MGERSEREAAAVDHAARRALPVDHQAPRRALLHDSALLFFLALVGAGLVHLLAYHMPLHVPLGLRWITTALYLLIHCPLALPIGVVLAVAVLVWLSTTREIGRLERVSTHLVYLVAARRAPRSAYPLASPPDKPVQPRSPRRLAVVVLGLLVAQAAVFTVADALFPMHMTMVMGGASMVMPATPAMPLWLLHAFVAVGLAVLFWLCERRLTTLRAQVAAYLRILLHACAAHVLVPSRRFHRPLGQWDGLHLFARPPPAR